jgi:hypothetical protein
MTVEWQTLRRLLRKFAAPSKRSVLIGWCSLQIGQNVTRSGKPILGSDGENAPTPGAERRNA